MTGKKRREKNGKREKERIRGEKRKNEKGEGENAFPYILKSQ